MSRPEHSAPPEIFYGPEESKKYTNNSRIIQIQEEMTERALELLNLEEENCLLLDLGCGSGLSGNLISESGHLWVGLDISQSMLDVARENEVEGDLFLQDLGQGLHFKPGTFDGAISISVIQWLCNADKSSHHPLKRMAQFFATLFSALKRGAKAVFQFYPENTRQIDMLTMAALKAGFTGGTVIDFPNSSKAKKYYLVLFAGSIGVLPKPLDDDDGNGEPSTSAYKHKARKSKGKAHDKEWILKKKETYRKRGYDNIPEDTKYTARKRKIKF